MLDGRKTVSWGPAVGALVVGGVAVGAVWLTVRGSAPPVKPVYTREGYGGIQLPAGAGNAAGKAALEKGGKAATSDPVAPALEAYNRGDYTAAEAAARALLAPTSPQVPTPERRNAATREAVPQPERLNPRTPEHLNPSPTRARARWVLAFSAARKKELAEAREQFAVLKQEAAGQDWVLDEVRNAKDAVQSEGADASRSLGTPTPALLRDRPVSPTGELLPTLEEEAAYQHAVLTAALASPAKAGEKPPAGERKPSVADAEREFVEFMRRYPESPLVHAAIRRIGRLHGGDIPKGAEAVWKAAMANAEKRRHARDRARSLCAPAVLAEVLRRTEGASPHAPSASPADVEALAQEMNTDHRGTALSALTQAAEKRGFQVSAFRLTWRALLQKMPLAGSTGRKGARGQGAWGPVSPGGYGLAESKGAGEKRVPVTATASDPQGSNYALRNTKYVIAFLEPGHVVLVEQAAAGVVRVWDPDGGGPQKPAPRSYTQSEWLDRWKGVTLILEQ